MTIELIGIISQLHLIQSGMTRCDIGHNFASEICDSVLFQITRLQICLLIAYHHDIAYFIDVNCIK